ncbi:hypothetical protein [Alkalihalobacterium bogoriense]|uniref:hypothetical protein n=1 Tax=Alkalihalobacterium bogoriense TaxID=246272 RepID=UPI00047E301C|nr:hypothetical protein [Alkalihalobacterium bogoriense]
MKTNMITITITVFIVLLLGGCFNNETMESNSDSYYEVKETAWNFINEQGWNETAKKNWQTAEVSKLVVDDNYELLDPTFEGKEVLTVSFEDDKDSVVSTPSILIDSDTNRVIGYMLSE